MQKTCKEIPAPFDKLRNLSRNDIVISSITRSCSYEPRNCKPMNWQQFYITFVQDDDLG